MQSELPAVADVETFLEGQGSGLADLMRAGLAYWMVVPFLDENTLVVLTLLLLFLLFTTVAFLLFTTVAFPSLYHCSWPT